MGLKLVWALICKSSSAGAGHSAATLSRRGVGRAGGQPQTLDKGGQYQLIVGNDTGAATGTYGFQIANAP